MGAQLLPSGKLLGRCRAAGDHEHQEPGERRARLGVTEQPPHEGLRTKQYQEENQPPTSVTRPRSELADELALQASWPPVRGRVFGAASAPAGSLKGLTGM